MEVSVIIPVYNCESWIRESIDSALYHDCIKEIIVVDDGSTDQSFHIVEALSAHNKRIKLFHHPGHINQGRSASRNLGIRNASCSWIAFLDADDTFLSNRFDGILIKDKIDGFYGITKSLFVENDQDLTPFEKQTAIEQNIAAEDLFYFLTNNVKERFSLLTVTVKKSILLEIAGFDEQLIIGEDTDLIWRIANQYKLQAQEVNVPIAQRRVHELNSHFSIYHQQHNRYLFYKKWVSKYPQLLSRQAFNRVLNSYLYYHPKKHQPLYMLCLKTFHLLRYQLTILLG